MLQGKPGLAEVEEVPADCMKALLADWEDSALAAAGQQACVGAGSAVLEQGQARTISLFYGAAHMAGLERVITGELGFEFEERLWLAAWQIP